MNGIVAAIQGRLPRDAGELRYAISGNPFVSFSLAVNDDRRGDDDDTEWVRVMVWGELAEELADELLKGREVYVEGRLRLKSWTTPDGEERPTLEVSAWKCEVLGAIGRRASRRGERRSA